MCGWVMQLVCRGTHEAQTTWTQMVTVYVYTPIELRIQLNQY